MNQRYTTAYNAYHDRADESWDEEEHPYHSSTEEAEDEPDYGESEVVRNMRLVSNDDWCYSRLRIDHNHVLEGGEGEWEETGKRQEDRDEEREEEGGGRRVERMNEEIGRQR